MAGTAPVILHPREVATLAREAVNEQGAAQDAKELAALGLYLVEHALLRPDGRMPNPLRVIVEIGAYKGGTCWFWRRIAPEAKIIAVDNAIECDGCRRRKAHSDCPFVRIDQNADVLIQRDSRDRDTAQIVAREAGLGEWRDDAGTELFQGGIDLLFIDGDHSAAGVEGDFQTYVPMLSGSGTVVLHDVAGPVAPQPNRERPTLAVQEFWHNLRVLVPQAFEIVERPGQGYGFGVIPKPD